ncbi:MAG: hypothetical protein HQL93_07405 [Magnetococcales bacterium]|nr:hypothetical protein [Magnetococcales bacterium]
MITDLLPIIRSQLKRSKSLTRINVALNAEDSLPGQASGPLLKLEEYEQELLLSRFFTPDHEDRAACEPVLPVEGLAVDEMERLIGMLAAETLSFPVVQGVETGFCPLPEIVMSRYVRLLGLEFSVDPRAAQWIATMFSGQERYQAMALARRPVWHPFAMAALLVRCLDVMTTSVSGSVAKLDFLTSFVRTYRCEQEKDLIRGLSSLVESYRIEQEHPTYNPRLETKQAESIRSSYCDDTVKQFRLAMARELLADFKWNH